MPMTLSSFVPKRQGRSAPLQYAAVLAAVCEFVACFVYCFIVPQTPVRMSLPSASLITGFPLWGWIVSLPLSIPDNPRALAALLTAAAVAAFAAYASMMLLSWKQPVERRALVFVLLPACAYLLFSTAALPNFNTDIYNYMLRGRLTAVYHKNPYTTAVREISSDPVYPYASHSYTDGPEWWKLPLWTSIEAGLGKLTGPDVKRNLFICRSVFLLVSLANLVLIGAILRKISPDHVLTGLVLYGWNPVVVLLGPSKGETFIVFFLLVAILLLAYRRESLAIVPLTLSALVKMTTLPFAAAFMLAELRQRRWRRYLLLGFLFVLTIGIFYRYYGLDGFLVAQLINIVWMSAESAPDFLRIFLRTVFVGLILLVGFTRQGNADRIVSGWVLLALYFSLFLISSEKAWYLIPLVALVSLVPDWRTVAMTLMISFSGFLLYTWNSSFNQEFASPLPVSSPRYVLYLLLPVLMLIAIGAVFLRRRFQPR